MELRKLDGKMGFEIIVQNKVEYEWWEDMLCGLYEWNHRDKERHSLASWKPLLEQVVTETSTETKL